MKSILSKPLLLALTVAALIAAVPAEAQRNRPPRDQLWPDASERPQEQRRRISIERAIQSVQGDTGGRVLDARDNGDEYRIKVLTREGEVRTVRVDAYTGAMR